MDTDYQAFSFLGKNALKCATIDSFLLTLRLSMAVLMVCAASSIG